MRIWTSIFRPCPGSLLLFSRRTTTSRKISSRSNSHQDILLHLVPGLLPARSVPCHHSRVLCKCHSPLHRMLRLANPQLATSAPSPYCLQYPPPCLQKVALYHPQQAKPPYPDRQVEVVSCKDPQQKAPAQARSWRSQHLRERCLRSLVKMMTTTFMLITTD